MADLSIKWSEVSAAKEQAWRNANNELDAARDASNLAKERLAADPTNTALQLEVKAASANVTAKVDASNAALDAMSTTPAPQQAAKDATLVPVSLPQAASGETTAENTDQNFRSGLLTKSTAPSTPVDNISGLQQKKTNVTGTDQFDENGVPLNQNTETDPNTPHYTHYDVNGVAIPGADSEPTVVKKDDVKIGATSEDKDKPCQPNISPNLLHNYASFTYNLSLHALSPADYKSLMDDPRGTYVPTNVLIAGAGRRGEGMQRSEHFGEDFFFDKLDFTTIIGMSARTKSANAIDINFTIIEPYGMTLLNRILQQSVIAKGNYLQIPYLLQIDFFGYNDDGIPMKIEDITKYIPIKIATMGMKVSQKGAEYNISAYPFNHQAFAESVSTNPIKLSVTASTVADFFDAMVAPKDYMGPLPESAESKAVTDVTTTNAAIRAEQERNSSTIRANTKEMARLDELSAFGYTKEDTDLRSSLATQNANLTERNLVLSKLPKTDVVVKSYTEAINAWLRQPVEDKRANYCDQIRFVIDDDIAEATFPDKDTLNKLTRAYSLRHDSEIGTKANVKDSEKPQSTISINQGMSILDVIELAIKNSSYVYDQILDVFDPDRTDITEDDIAELMKPLDWFKVIPTIDLGEYDTKTNSFARTITYHIIKSTLYNTKSEDAPQGKPKHYVKNYEYIFTGKNYDILNFDLNFDTLYFTVIPGNPAIKDPVNQSAAKKATDDPKTAEVTKKFLSKEEVKKFVDARFNGNAALHPKKIFTAPLPGNSGNDDSVAESLKRLSKNILSSSAGDMIRVDLKILGDPDFIKQDDIFYRPGMYSLSNGLKTWNNSLITDQDELFVRLAFKTPGDYDDTGLARPDTGKYTANAFSGIYKVIQVKNHFAQGKFEQNLELIRYPNQPTEGDEQLTAETKAGTRPVDEFGDLDGAIARQKAMSDAAGTTTGDTLITASPIVVGKDIPTAMSDPSQSAAAKMLAAEGVGAVSGDPSQSAAYNMLAANGTNGNSIDVDKVGGLGVQQTNSLLNTDALPNQYADVVDAKVVPISSSSSTGTVYVAAETAPASYVPTSSISSKNLAIDKIQNQILDNNEALTKANYRLNTYPIDSAEWKDAKREAQMYARNNQNLADNLKTVQAEKNALLNG